MVVLFFSLSKLGTEAGKFYDCLVIREQRFETCLIPRDLTTWPPPPEGMLKTSRTLTPRRGWTTTTASELLGTRRDSLWPHLGPLCSSPMVNLDPKREEGSADSWGRVVEALQHPAAGEEPGLGLWVGLRLHFVSIPGTHPCVALPAGQIAHSKGPLREASLLTCRDSRGSPPFLSPLHRAGTGLD